MAIILSLWSCYQQLKIVLLLMTSISLKYHIYTKRISFTKIYVLGVYTPIFLYFSQTLLLTLTFFLSNNIIKLLICYGVYINRCRRTIGRLFTYTVQKGRESLVRYFLDEGADINAKSLAFALIVACNKDYYNIIKYLINRGANINVWTNYGFLLSRACAMGRKNIIFFFLFGMGLKLTT